MTPKNTNEGSVTPGQVWTWLDFDEVLVEWMYQDVSAYLPEDEAVVTEEPVKVKLVEDWNEFGIGQGEAITAYADELWENGEYLRDADIIRDFGGSE